MTKEMIAIITGFASPAILIVLNDLVGNMINRAQRKLRPDLWRNREIPRVLDKYRVN